jgi:hypothetical protein
MERKKEEQPIALYFIIGIRNGEEDGSGSGVTKENIKL